MKIYQNLEDIRVNLKNFFTKNPKVVEIHLLNFNEDMPKAWQHILDIYQLVLYKDDYWHFFYEGPYSIIRCSKKYKKDVKKYLIAFNIEYKDVGPWVDGSKSVEKYKNRFIHLFHEFSMLAMELEEGWFLLVADRICHCFFNHCTYMAEESRDRYGTNMWEAVLMGHLSIYRARHVGMIDHDESCKSRIVNKEVKECEE